MRVFRCGHCKNTYDLAVTVPELKAKMGRELTDDEMERLPEGWWHTCAKTFLQGEREQEPGVCLTRYDWRARR